jgi:hypothetical protein
LQSRLGYQDPNSHDHRQNQESQEGRGRNAQNSSDSRDTKSNVLLPDSALDDIAYVDVHQRSCKLFHYLPFIKSFESHLIKKTHKIMDSQILQNSNEGYKVRF